MWLAATPPWLPPIQLAGLLGVGWAESGPATGLRFEVSQAWVDASLGIYTHYPGSRFQRYEALPIRPYPLGRAMVEVGIPVSGDTNWNVGPAIAFDVTHTPITRLLGCDRAPVCVYPGLSGGVGGRARFAPVRGAVYAYEAYLGLSVSGMIDGTIEPRPRARLAWVYDSGQTVSLSFTGRGDALLEVGYTHVRK